MTATANLNYPLRCISYYSSNLSTIDSRHSFEYFFRHKLLRIRGDKPFARGDMLDITNMQETSTGVVMDAAVVTQEEYSPAPVLVFVSNRFVYNPYADFSYETSGGVQLINVVETNIDDNFSSAFICLVTDAGQITCTDPIFQNNYDIKISLDWSK